ncbi:hypothetical protein D2E70_25390 [Mycobacteroides abscessus]|uniref:hypothetical protein n=1 Tax=Mycobacteroides abscessus TaxID=36809 RepID=UPI000E694EB0|nr:hypothetical protein [Mycobacteroides abscessus]RIS64210.1 hypothetical protein D2E70_25390 [Mycobacteroides abscessus]
MARKNVYLPDEMAEEVENHSLNLSAITQEGVRTALADLGTPMKGKPMDTVSEAKLQYLATQFDTARTKFDDAVQSQAIPEGKAKTILMHLQGIAQALEGASFDRL